MMQMFSKSGMYFVADEDFQVKEFLLMRCCLRICLNKMLSFREEAMYETMQTSDKLTDSWWSSYRGRLVVSPY